MEERELPVPALIVPAGTHVVTISAAEDARGAMVAAGAVGVIRTLPAVRTALYGIELTDGRTVQLPRSGFRIRRSEARALPEASADAVLAEHRASLVFVCIVGSHAYGLAGAGSDVDRRGIYVPPAEVHWSLAGAPEQLEDRATDESYWEVQKFITLALKANPNILECLYTPLVEHVDPLIADLLSERAIFLSQLVFQTYNGYVLSQFKRLEQDLRTAGALNWKHAMHLIRLLLSGIGALRDGSVPVQVVEHREALLAIKRGEVAWPEVNAWRLALHRELEAALRRTELPERPDYARANALLIDIRRQVARRTEGSTNG